MPIISLPPEMRKHLNGDEGTVTFVFTLDSPLQAAPSHLSETILEELALNGTSFRVVAGPGFTWRFIREHEGDAHEAVANLAPLAGTRSLRFVLRWQADGEVALDVGPADASPGPLVKGRSEGYTEA